MLVAVNLLKSTLRTSTGRYSEAAGLLKPHWPSVSYVVPDGSQLGVLSHLSSFSNKF